MKKKELQLQKDIGKKLYNKLSKEDRDWIIKTEGSMNLGHPVDLKEIQRILNNDDEYYD